MKRNLLFLFFLIIGFGLHGSTPWQNAVKAKNISAMGQLLVQNPTWFQNSSIIQSNIQPNINTHDAQGRTVLMWAVMSQNVSLVQELLAIPGIDINATAGGKTALDYAQDSGNQEIINLLTSTTNIPTITLSGLQTITNNQFSPSLQNNQFQNVTINGGLQLTNSQLIINGNLIINCTQATTCFSIDSTSSLTVTGGLVINGNNKGNFSNMGRITVTGSITIENNQGLNSAGNTGVAVYNSGKITSYGHISISANLGFNSTDTNQNGSHAVYNVGTITIPSSPQINSYLSIVGNSGGSGANGGYALFNMGTIANNSAGGTYPTTGLPSSFTKTGKSLNNVGIMICNNTGGNNTVYTGAGGMGIYNNNQITSTNAIYIIQNNGGNDPNYNQSNPLNQNNSYGGTGVFNNNGYILSTNGPINISNNIGGSALFQGGHGFYNNGQVKIHNRPNISTETTSTPATIIIDSNKGGNGSKGTSNIPFQFKTYCNPGGNGGHGFWNYSSGTFYATNAQVTNNTGGNAGNGGNTAQYFRYAATSPCNGGNPGYGAINNCAAGFYNLQQSFSAFTLENNTAGIAGNGGTVVCYIGQDQGICSAKGDNGQQYSNTWPKIIDPNNPQPFQSW